MKLLVHKISTLFTALTLFGSSAGVYVYSNFCAGENIFEQSIVKFDHQCDSESSFSCHKTNLKECGSEDDSDCCTSKVEYEELGQILATLNDYQTGSLALVAQSISGTWYSLEQPINTIYNVWPPPPKKGRAVVINLQRFLC